jgi:hypothetical protein
MAPIDPLEEVAKLGRRYHQNALRWLRPYELAALETLGIKRHTETVMPEDLQKSAAAAPEDIEIAAMRVPPKGFLDQQRSEFIPRRMSV